MIKLNRLAIFITCCSSSSGGGKRRRRRRRRSVFLAAADTKAVFCFIKEIFHFVFFFNLINIKYLGFFLFRKIEKKGSLLYLN